MVEEQAGAYDDDPEAIDPADLEVEVAPLPYADLAEDEELVQDVDSDPAPDVEDET
jgi:hypothetical protein